MHHAVPGKLCRDSPPQRTDSSRQNQVRDSCQVCQENGSQVDCFNRRCWHWNLTHILGFEVDYRQRPDFGTKYATFAWEGKVRWSYHPPRSIRFFIDFKVTRCQSICVLGAGKSSADMIFDAVMAGKKVTWLLKASETTGPGFLLSKGQRTLQKRD